MRRVPAALVEKRNVSERFAYRHREKERVLEKIEAHLYAGTSQDGALELHQGATNLVAEGGVALVVDGGPAAAEEAAATSSCRRGGGCVSVCHFACMWVELGYRMV